MPPTQKCKRRSISSRKWRGIASRSSKLTSKLLGAPTTLDGAVSFEASNVVIHTLLIWWSHC
jgi:hypothetical protein